MEADIAWISTGLPTQYVMHTMQANVRDGKPALGRTDLQPAAVSVLSRTSRRR